MQLNINLKKELDDSYEIIFTQNIGDKLSDFLLLNSKKRILIISDSNVYPLHFYNLLLNINSEIEVFSLEIKAGEENKTINTVLDINKKLIELNFNRGDILVALGGGVVGDIVGFSASIFKRGIDFIQIPTTLLSMFDSSVGGKTGVDFDGIKNIIGAFKQPKLVLINSNYLETLPKEEVLSGYFEGLKHSLIKSEEYFQEFIKESELFFNNNSLSTEGF
ncbi:MAG: iron-containing alcohol dehydrogenase [Candidatus Gracilibacteria bacterium]|nr:iron-containing alcohol dehydrogenase [Candidatus Gracilibacteria bacterium]